jgi:signal transduction histidine kinase
VATSPEAFAAAGAADAAPPLRAELPWPAATAQRAALLGLPLVAASSLFLGGTSNHLADPGAAAMYATYIIAAPVLVGLAWWRRRPGSRLGPLLVALGYLSWPISWQGSEVPLLYTLGVVAAAAPIALSLYVCLAFSTGRLRTAAERRLVAVLVLVLTLFFGTALLTSHTLVGEGPIAACAAACPGNPFQLSAQPQLQEAVGRFATYVGLGVVAGIAAVWIRRLRAATRPQRRLLVPVAASSLLLVPTLFVVYYSVLVLGVDGRTYEALSWLLVGMWILFPLGFAVALLQADLFAGRALRQLLSELAGHPTPQRWRDIVAGALDDPSLRLAYWDPHAGHFRDAAGELAQPQQRSGRQWTEVRRDGLRVAALDTDDALVEHSELLDVAASATLLAVETGRLEGELRASQARALAAADAERRRIGRDLHDTAQQRLVALRVHLGLAGARLQPEELPIVEQLERELDAALDELQNVTRGIYPHALAQYGLAAALRSAVRSAAIPVSMLDETDRRHPGPVELAVYFCCLEALQNAAKHAGPGASASIWLSDADGALRFRVEDDGRGFDPESTEPGAGLSNLAERLRSAGGSIRIDSAVGRGTRVLGHIPA